jgi:hypothetical protein
MSLYPGNESPNIGLPLLELFSGDCLKPFDGVMVTDNGFDFHIDLSAASYSQIDHRLRHETAKVELITSVARRSKRVVVQHLHQLVQLPSPNAHVPAIEQR